MSKQQIALYTLIATILTAIAHVLTAIPAFDDWVAKRFVSPQPNDNPNLIIEGEVKVESIP